ncbi:MAG: ABC transporter ATP-binding protein [Alphaproteobacteria bacterium]
MSKSFGRVTALHPSSLEIAAGELVALLGPSGCGKTTTLRLIAGFEVPDTGSIHIGTREVTELSPNRRRVGMVFQNYSLFPHMSVGENIAFGLKMARLPGAEIAARVRAILELVRLPGYEERYAHQLSGGQQQRVALARSLVTNPSVLLLDEPLGALDKNLRESMQFELRQLQQQLGITSVLVTHDQEEALTMSDRVAVMDRGHILQVGTPGEVYERPLSRFVSEFLGTANLFRCGVAAREAGGQLRLALPLEGGETFHFTASAGGKVPSGHELPAGHELLVAIRPERIAIATASKEGEPGLRASVLAHVFRGSYHAYQVRVAGRGEVVFVYAQATHAEGRDILPPGSAVMLRWLPENVILLPEDAP